VFKAKRAITGAEEHAATVAREPNAERRDFYELLWHTGASQTDAACLPAEDVDWNSRTISYVWSIGPVTVRMNCPVGVTLNCTPGMGVGTVQDTSLEKGLSIPKEEYVIAAK